MDIVLIGITIASLLAALVMSVVAWRATESERRRAAARAATLATAAQGGPEDAMPVPSGRPWRPAAQAATPAGSGRDPGAISTEAPAGEVTLHSGFLGGAAARTERSSPQRGLAVAAVVIATLSGVVVFWSGGRETTTRAAAAAAPLELLSLQHQREGVNLSVSGLVRNPAAAPPVAGVIAVVLLFDAQGTFVTSGTAPVDFTRLSSGDESPFVIKVQAPQSVARYRVSFRVDEGTLPHVDRRGDGPVTTPVALTRP